MPKRARLRPRILLLDEDADLLEMMAEFLGRTTRASIQAVSSGQAAIEQHVQQPCDVIVTTADPPDMHFTTLADRLAPFGRPRVVLLCGRPEAEQMIQALRVGVADIVTKPVDPDELLSSVQRQLARRQQQIVARRQARRTREDAQRDRVHGKVLQERLERLSREVVGDYQRLATRVAEMRPE